MVTRLEVFVQEPINGQSLVQEVDSLVHLSPTSCEVLK